MGLMTISLTLNPVRRVLCSISLHNPLRKHCLLPALWPTWDWVPQKCKILLALQLQTAAGHPTFLLGVAWSTWRCTLFTTRKNTSHDWMRLHTAVQVGSSFCGVLHLSLATSYFHRFLSVADQSGHDDFKGAWFFLILTMWRIWQLRNSCVKGATPSCQETFYYLAFLFLDIAFLGVNYTFFPLYVGLWRILPHLVKILQEYTI